jgi:hypothetical protein
MTEGWEAAGLYLLYVPAIIAFFTTCILLFISLAICTFSFQWARRIVCLFAYVFGAFVLAPFVLLPHLMLGVPLVVAVTDGTWKWDACTIAIVSVLALVTIYWSRGLYRFEKENKWLSGIWGFANKYVKNNSGAKKKA